jgi:predicted flavoprotein YhiN
MCDLRLVEGRLAVTTPHRVVTAPRVILTTGGQSYPGSGTTGDGYTVASALATPSFRRGRRWSRSA